MTLSPPMVTALALMARHHPKPFRTPGQGIWTHEPDEWPQNRDALSDPWVRTETMRALWRRGLVQHSKTSSGDEIALTEDGLILGRVTLQIQERFDADDAIQEAAPEGPGADEGNER